MKLLTIKSISIYGTLSEEEGLKTLKKNKNVDLVLIGGRYSDEQRVRILTFIKTNMPSTKTKEPGYDYPYENNEILKHVEDILYM